MIRRTFAPPWLLAFVLLLAACSLTPRRTLTLWHTLDEQQERALLHLVDRWNANGAHPVYIVPQRRTPRAQHAALLGKAAPNIALVPAAQAALYSENGLLRTLDDLEQGDQGFNTTDRADLFPFVFEAGRTPQGKLIGLPLGGTVRLMLVDVNWLSEQNLPLPIDRAGLQRICETAAATGACFAAQMNGVMLQEWLRVNSASLLSPDNRPLLDDAQTRQLVSSLVESIRNGTIVAAVSDSQVTNEFASGRVPIAFEWSSSLRSIASLVAAGSAHEWDVAPVPGSSVGTCASTLRAPLLVLPHTDPASELQAWSFIRWMLDTEQTAQWAIDTDEFPARLSAITTIDPARAPKNFARAVQRIGAAARVEPLLASWPCVIEGLDQSALQLTTSQSVSDTLASAQSIAAERIAAPCALR